MILKKRASRVLREELFHGKLRCGLEMVVLPKRGFSKKVAIFAARYGSVDLAFSPDGEERLETPPGIAHFLEHQLFKKEDGRDALMEFGKYGASSNAFTDYCTTAYYFAASAEFEKNLELLVSFVSAPFFGPENVSKERLIIEQELRMYQDSPDHRIYKNLMKVLYSVHPVRIDIGGEVEDLRKIDASLLERCYRMFYNPANMVLLAAGDVEPVEVERQVEGLLPPERFASRPLIRRILPEEPAGVQERVVRSEMTLSRPRVLVGFKDLEVGREGTLERELETSIVLDLLFGRSSEFYTRNYEKGLIDDSFSFSHNRDEPYGFSLLGGETDEPEKLAEEILLELHRAGGRRLKRRDVERSKRKRLGRFIRSFDTPDGAAFLTLGCVQRGIDLFAIPRTISRISPRALDRRLAAHFDERNYAASILVPEGSPAGRMAAVRERDG